MINEGQLLAAALWIAGSALLLAALGYRVYLRTFTPPILGILWSGLCLFCVGMLLSSSGLLATFAWTVFSLIALLCLVRSAILIKVDQRHRRDPVD